jgi:hypothetical protein
MNHYKVYFCSKGTGPTTVTIDAQNSAAVRAQVEARYPGAYNITSYPSPPMKLLSLSLVGLLLAFTTPGGKARATPNDTLPTDEETGHNAQSDEQYKSELLGYWQIERHAWLLLADGRMLSCPTTGPDASMLGTEHWDVRNGIFYWLDPEAGSNYMPYKIIALNKRQLIIQSLSGDETDTFYRLSRVQAGDLP